MNITSISGAVALNDGVEMPRFGLGVWQARSGRETRHAVLGALAAGSRHFDPARISGNDMDAGAAGRERAVPRDRVFVTTKLWNRDQGYDSAKRALAVSLRDLGLDYVDLYLEHWPVEGKRLDSWRALQELRADGYARSIGVSNFQPRHLDELLAVADVVPSVNQVEFSPFLYQRDLLEACRTAGIQLEAYSPLTRGRRLDEPVLVEIAARHGKTAAQVLIRWSLQHDLVVIPKSVRRERIIENADVFDFDLSDGEMARFDALDEGHREAWDPTDVP